MYPIWRHLLHLGMILIHGLLAFGVHVLLCPVLAISLEILIAAGVVSGLGGVGLVGLSLLVGYSGGRSSASAEEPRSLFQGG